MFIVAMEFVSLQIPQGNNTATINGLSVYMHVNSAIHVPPISYASVVEKRQIATLCVYVEV